MKASVIIIAITILALGAGFFYIQNTFQNDQISQPNIQQLTEENSSTSSAKTIPGYSGRLLAGSSSPFLEFNKADYEKALSEGKIIILDFYANWCPICRAEEPALHAGFDSLTTDQVIGFRVNYNDSETDSDEKALAKQFNITYQHTKVVLKMGKEFSKSLESWDKQKFDQEINKPLQ